jgi:hypothetical protein
LHQLLLPSSSLSLKIFNLQKDAARLTSLEEARTLADCSSTAMLSTISQRYSGSPFGSLVLYATDDDGCPILAISSLSPHTKDLEVNSKCSMLIARDAMDIRDPSVAVIGEAETVRASFSLCLYIAKCIYLKELVWRS